MYTMWKRGKLLISATFFENEMKFVGKQRKSANNFLTKSKLNVCTLT